MTAEWCTEILQQAIATHGKPQIVNSDQGSQFTSEVYIQLLKDVGVIGGISLVSFSSSGRNSFEHQNKLLIFE